MTKHGGFGNCDLCGWDNGEIVPGSDDPAKTLCPRCAFEEGLCHGRIDRFLSRLLWLVAGVLACFVLCFIFWKG